MDKRSYFKTCLHAGLTLRKHWILSAFADMVHEVYDPGKHVLPAIDAMQNEIDCASTYPYRIFRMADNSDDLAFISPMNELIPMGANPTGGSLFNFREKVLVDAEMYPGLGASVETCYGNVMVSWLLAYLPFKNKIPFLIGKTAGNIEAMILDKYSRIPPPSDPSERDPSMIYVDEYLVFQKHLAYLDNWATISIPTVTLAGLTPNKEVATFIKEKLKEKGDGLTVTDLAIIEQEAAKMDKASMEGKPDAGFLTKKNYNVNRKKMFYIYGLEAGFGEETIIKAPLTDGVKAEDLPAYANALRSGSYGRGKQTALAGVGVKRANQIFQAVEIKEPDCGDDVGLKMQVIHANELQGTYIKSAGKWVILNKAQRESYVGKGVTVRSPWSCQTPSPHYCAMCAGEYIAALPRGVHNSVAAISSKEMLLFMKAMHGKSLSTKDFDIGISIN